MVATSGQSAYVDVFDNGAEVIDQFMYNVIYYRIALYGESPPYRLGELSVYTFVTRLITSIEDETPNRSARIRRLDALRDSVVRLFLDFENWPLMDRYRVDLTNVLAVVGAPTDPERREQCRRRLTLTVENHALMFVTGDQNGDFHFGTTRVLFSLFPDNQDTLEIARSFIEYVRYAPISFTVLWMSDKLSASQHVRSLLKAFKRSPGAIHLEACLYPYYRALSVREIGRIIVSDVREVMKEDMTYDPTDRPTVLRTFRNAMGELGLVICIVPECSVDTERTPRVSDFRIGDTPVAAITLYWQPVWLDDPREARTIGVDASDSLAQVIEDYNVWHNQALELGVRDRWWDGPHTESRSRSLEERLSTLEQIYA